MCRLHNSFPQCPGCHAPVSLCYCGEGPKIIAQEAERIDVIAEVGRRLWRELFLEVQTLDDLAAWEQRVPNYECKCKAFYEHWKKSNPTIVHSDDLISFEWKWSLKSAINRKLDHANLSLEEARRHWFNVAASQSALKPEQQHQQPLK